MQADKLSSIGLLAAGVAHEVNTPLAVISTYAQMLAKQVNGDEQKSQAAGQDRQADLPRQRDRQLAAEFLAHLDRRSSNELDLNQVIRETLSLLEHQLEKHGIRGAQRIWTRDLPPISGNAGKLQQVFLNLFLNARDAMADWRRALRACARRAPAPRASRVEVPDTGPGIAREHLARIYDPFFTTKGAQQGHGPRTVASPTASWRSTAASIEADSRSPAQGTRFRLEFPAVEETGQCLKLTRSQTGPEPTPGAAAFWSSTTKPTSARAWKTLLELEGYAVQTGARTPPKGCGASRPAIYDLVLLDLMMPDRSGMEVLDDIRERDPETPVFLITAYGSVEVAVQALKAGANDYFSKPWDNEKLLIEIDRQIARTPAGAREHASSSGR